MVQKLQRPLPDDKKDEATYIFGTNFDINFFNYDKLSKLPGNMKIYETKDRCPQKYLKTCSAPMVLPIKLNCKVIVIQNLDNGLVNGLTGTVIHMNENIHVKIDEDDKMDHNLGGCVFNLKRMEFILHDENNQKVGNRWQFPLKLGYAMTVDKDVPEPQELNDIELNVLRYVSGACIHHVSKHMKLSVERKLLGKLRHAKVYYRAQRVQKLEEDHELNQAFCNLFTAYKSDCMCNAEEAEINSEMSTVLHYELEESLILHVYHKVILYMGKVHLNDNLKNVGYSLKEGENFSIETFIWIHNKEITSYT